MSFSNALDIYIYIYISRANINLSYFGESTAFSYINRFAEIAGLLKF